MKIVVYATFINIKLKTYVGKTKKSVVTKFILKLKSYLWLQNNKKRKTVFYQGHRHNYNYRVFLKLLKINSKNLIN